MSRKRNKISTPTAPKNNNSGAFKNYAFSSSLKTSIKFGESLDTKGGLEWQNLLKREPVRPGMKDLAEKILPFGENNAFPLVLAQLVQESPTASSCIDTRADFIEGSGFSDDNIKDLKINEQKETFGKIHSENSQTLSMYDGIALNIKYNLEYKISEIYAIPFENCRLAIPDQNGYISKIRYNPYYGTSQFLRSWTQEYDVYNPDPEIIKKQIETSSKKGEKYKGQILYESFTKPLSRFYSMPSYYSAEYWMRVDAQIGQFQSNNLNNGFYQSVLFKLIGDPNRPSNHPDDQKFNTETKQYEPIEGTNVGTRFDQTMQQFTGSERAGNIMTFWSESKDAMPEITAFPQGQTGDFLDKIDDKATEKICIATKVPSILANVSIKGHSLGAEAGVIRSAVKIMQHRVKKHQSFLERIYKDLLTHWHDPIINDLSIISFNPFPEVDKVDPYQWAALTTEEQRSWLKANTDFPVDLTKQVPKIPQAAIKPPNPQPQAIVSATFIDLLLNDYPESAKKSAKEALNWKNKASISCGTPKGWKRAEKIANGEPLEFKEVKNINNWLKKNKDSFNKLMNDSCEAVLFRAWGGNDMLKWSEGVIKMVMK